MKERERKTLHHVTRIHISQWDEIIKQRAFV